MKIIKKAIVCVLSAALMVTAMPEGAAAAAKPVKLEKGSLTLRITKKDGKTIYGKAKIRLKTAKGVKVRSTKYRVKNKKIVRVSKKGIVTARKKGTTKVFVTVKYVRKKKFSTRKLTLKVKVKKVEISGQPTAAPGGRATATPDSSPLPTPEITPDPSKVAQIHLIRRNYITYVGGNTGLNPQVLPETAENPELAYESADAEIAVVNEYGLITGVKEGVTTIGIKATDGSGVTGRVTVKVVENREVAEYVDDYYDAANAPIIQDVLENQEGTEVPWSTVRDMENTVSKRGDAIIRNAVEHAEDQNRGSAGDQIAAFYQTAADKAARETNGIGGLSAYVDRIDGADTVEELLAVEAELDRKGIAGIFNTSTNVSKEDQKTYQLCFYPSDYVLSEYSQDMDDVGMEEEPTAINEYTEGGGNMAEDAAVAADGDMAGNANMAGTGIAGDDVGDVGGEGEFEGIDSEEALHNYADSLLEAAGEDESRRSESIKALKEIFKEFSISYDSIFDELLGLPEDITEEELMQILEEMGLGMMVEYSPEELQAMLKNCDIISYLETAGYDTTENVVVMMPSQMKQIDACLTQENLLALKEYAKYEMLNQYSTYMTEEIYNAYSQLYEAENGVAFTAYEDFALSNTKELLEWEISSLYTEQYASAEKKQEITDMVEEIVGQYSKEIAACRWMSAATKENAQKKLSALSKNILYPDDYSQYLLESDLLGTEEGGNLLDNVMMIDGEYAEAERAAIGDKMTNQDWMYSPLKVNAFYMPTVNGIYICSGIVEAPVYDSEKSDAANYGGLGMIIAHEISHAFDETGALYDENGDAADWWTEDDASHYANIQQRLIDYYNTYYLLALEDMPIFQEGQTTLSENIADLAGVACVLKLAGEDKDTRKEFFMNFANLWAEVGTLTEDNLLILMFDTHSAAKVRVNAVVSMLDEFYETFDVRENDAMYVAPEERIRIWE